MQRIYFIETYKTESAKYNDLEEQNTHNSLYHWKSLYWCYNMLVTLKTTGICIKYSCRSGYCDAVIKSEQEFRTPNYNNLIL